MTSKERERIANIIAKELPVNYDGTNPGNWHILLSVANAIIDYRDKHYISQEEAYKICENQRKKYPDTTIWISRKEVVEELKKIFRISGRLNVQKDLDQLISKLRQER